MLFEKSSEVLQLSMTNSCKNPYIISRVLKKHQMYIKQKTVYFVTIGFIFLYFTDNKEILRPDRESSAAPPILISIYLLPKIICSVDLT